jgi:hypothetical protein
VGEEYRFESDTGGIRVTWSETAGGQRFEVNTWLPKRPYPDGFDADANELRMRRIERDIVQAVEDLEKRDRLSIVRRNIAYDRAGNPQAGEPDPYLVAAVSAASGVAAQQLASFVRVSIKKILLKRKKSDGEDWRESRGYL